MNDKSIKVSGGTQYITTPDDHIFPLNIKSRLPYMNIRLYTDDECNTLYMLSLHQMMNGIQPSLTTLLMMMMLIIKIGMIQFQTSLLDTMNHYLTVLEYTNTDISSMVLI